MVFVIDASVTLPWFLIDERTAFTDSMFDAAMQGGYWVPPIWCLEFPNALLMAQRKRRIDRMTRLGALERVAMLPLRIDTSPVDMKSVSDFAERRGLSIYDASYLELAVRLGSGLVTLDRALAGAAASEGVEVLAPGRTGVAQTRRRYAARKA